MATFLNAVSWRESTTRRISLYTVKIGRERGRGKEGGIEGGGRREGEGGRGKEGGGRREAQQDTPVYIYGMTPMHYVHTKYIK